MAEDTAKGSPLGDYVMSFTDDFMKLKHAYSELLKTSKKLKESKEAVDAARKTDKEKYDTEKAQLERSHQGQITALNSRVSELEARVRTAESAKEKIETAYRNEVSKVGTAYQEKLKAREDELTRAKSEAERYRQDYARLQENYKAVEKEKEEAIREKEEAIKRTAGALLLAKERMKEGNGESVDSLLGSHNAELKSLEKAIRGK